MKKASVLTVSLIAAYVNIKLWYEVYPKATTAYDIEHWVAVIGLILWCGINGYYMFFGGSNK